MTGKSNQSKQVYLFVIFTWLLLIGILCTIIIQSSIRTAEDSFKTSSMSLYNIVSEKVKTTETIIEGFAASVNLIGEIDRGKIRIYAKHLIQRYPHIFMFEIAEKIEKKNLKRFENKFKKTIYPDFKIKAYSYETDRSWQKLDEKTFYMPITFMEPFPEKSKNVLGLDLSSNKFLINSLRQSAKLNRPVITEPFKLVEGDLAYLIHSPIENNKNKHFINNKGVAPRYVMLVILAKSLFDDKLISMQDFSVILYDSRFKLSDPKGRLHNQSSINKTFIEKVIFPNLSLSLALKNKSQPFVLHVEKQLGWEVINWWLISTLLLVAAISFYLLRYYAKVFHSNEVSRMQETNQLFYQANHDSLTGLANRNLLLDRLQHALRQAKRIKNKLAVLFMDLDDFKPVNDMYGHDFGDKLLNKVSDRLLACVRSGDTLARRSGDEFILVIENIENEDEIKIIMEKIYDAFDSRFKIEQIELNVSISIGYAIFPDDADDLDELLNIADKKMYENKLLKGSN